MSNPHKVYDYLKAHHTVGFRFKAVELSVPKMGSHQKSSACNHLAGYGVIEAVNKESTNYIYEIKEWLPEDFPWRKFIPIVPAAEINRGHSRIKKLSDFTRVANTQPEMQTFDKHRPTPDMVMTDFTEVEQRMLAHMQAVSDDLPNVIRSIRMGLVKLRTSLLEQFTEAELLGELMRRSKLK